MIFEHRKDLRMKLKYIVEKQDHQKKVVDILCGRLGMSRLLSKRIRLYGTLNVNGNHYRMIDPVSEGDCIFISYQEPAVVPPLILEDRDNIKVLFCDEHILVVSKPAGIVTHPTSGHSSGTLTDLFPELKLHPVSRLDRETSGVIILARDPHSHYLLSLQHQNKSIEKDYIGFVHGVFNPREGSIKSSIKRKPDSIMLRCVADDGDTAVTHYETIRSFETLDTSVVKYRLETGRTHQIRVHSLSVGHPLIGDGLYGASSRDNGHYQKSAFLDVVLGRQALHASSITFTHPITKERLTCTAEMPEDMKDLLGRMAMEDSMQFQSEKGGSMTP